MTVPGESGASGLNGTRNTQGRFLNKPDVPDDWCNLGATPATYSEKFLHIEQASDEGRPADKRIRDPEHWVRAIVAAWSTDPPPPPPIVVRGIAFADANGSGAREPGEAGLGGATVYLDANGNGRPDDGETTRAGTDAAGAYALRVGAGGPARLCISGLPAEFVPTTSRCQMVAGTAPTLDFGADRRLPGCTRGALSATIQSVALAGDPARYHRPTGLEGTARGPWAGTRLTIQPGGSNPVVAVMGGEGVATGLFVGGVDAAAVPNLVLRLRYQRSFQGVVAVVAADGTPAPIIGGGPGLPDPLPTTFAAWDRDGELYIFGVPADGAGGYQDVYVVTEITASRGYITANAGIAGTVRDGRIAALGNTCGDGADSRIERRQGGVRPDAVPADDIPDREGVTNPY